MSKTYVLDTNVLLHNPHAIFAFEENEVVLPFAVIEEIDNQKRRQDEVGKNARTISQILDAMRSQGRLSEGVLLPQGGMLRIELNHREILEFPPGLDPDKHDNRILAVAINLGRDPHREKVVLVTKDLNLRIKADVMDLKAEDFHRDKVRYDRLYSGMGEIHLTSDEMDAFRANGVMQAPPDETLHPNQMMVLKNTTDPSRFALARHVDGILMALDHADAVNWGIRALNREQKFAVELLLDDSIPVVSLVGCAGTGKTLLALAVGLEKVLEQRAYSRLLVTRPVTAMGEDLGYLPGDKEEKLRPWMQPIFDNLEYLMRDSSDPFQILDELLKRGTLEMEALTYIRGRSIPRHFIICDEAQNLTPHMVKTILTRVGEGTKIVFTGDPEQIDHPYLDASSNGLTHLVEKLKGEKLSGHVTLFKGERSRVAEMGANLL